MPAECRDISSVTVVVVEWVYSDSNDIVKKVGLESKVCFKLSKVFERGGWFSLIYYVRYSHCSITYVALSEVY